MKTAISFLALIIFSVKLTAQNGTIAVQNPNGPVTAADTISAGSYVCLDTTVISFVVSIKSGGIILTKTHTGNCFIVDADARPGSIIYISQIVAQPKTGVRTRLPSKQFVVR